MHAARIGNRKDAYGVLVGRPEGKRPFGRCGIRWEDNIKIVLQDEWRAWTRLIWLRKGTGGVLLCMRQ